MTQVVLLPSMACRIARVSQSAPHAVSRSHHGATCTHVSGRRGLARGLPEVLAQVRLVGEAASQRNVAQGRIRRTACIAQPAPRDVAPRKRAVTPPKVRLKEREKCASLRSMSAQSMRERAVRIMGKFLIESSAGSGTVLTLTGPGGMY